MTVVAERKAHVEATGYEVRFGGKGQVVAYVVSGPGAASLEQALTDNGFWLVPVQSRTPSDEHTHTAA